MRLVSRADDAGHTSSWRAAPVLPTIPVMRRHTRLLRGLWVCLCAGGLLGCGGGVDESIETSSEAAYQESLQNATKDMSQYERDALSWALSDLNFAAVRERYRG